MDTVLAFLLFTVSLPFSMVGTVLQMAALPFSLLTSMFQSAAQWVLTKEKVK